MAGTGRATAGVRGKIAVVLIGLGVNLAGAQGQPVTATLAEALAALNAEGVTVVRQSRWYRSAPVPVSGQPWFTNGVAAVTTALSPEQVLTALLATEAKLGRHRTVPNAARPVDLDLLAYDERVLAAPGLAIPHPRMHTRAFVLLPLADVAPGWRHPVLGRTVEELIAALPPGSAAEPELGETGRT